jgi:hypothetical protein
MKTVLNFSFKNNSSTSCMTPAIKSDPCDHGNDKEKNKCWQRIDELFFNDVVRSKKVSLVTF